MLINPAMCGSSKKLRGPTPATRPRLITQPAGGDDDQHAHRQFRGRGARNRGYTVDVTATSRPTAMRRSARTGSSARKDSRRSPASSSRCKEAGVESNAAQPLYLNARYRRRREGYVQAAPTGSEITFTTMWAPRRG